MTENTRTIKEICEAYGITQTELSRKYGIPLRTVQDWHAGRRTPPGYVVNMIEKLMVLEYPYLRADELKAFEEKLNEARMAEIKKRAKPISEEKRKELQARLDAGEKLTDIFKPKRNN